MTVKLRKVGGSTMIAIPPDVLRRLRVGPGAELELAAEPGRLVLRPPVVRYRLADLLRQCSPRARRPRADSAWLNAPRRGAELL